jgi:hypothetical protein
MLTPDKAFEALSVLVPGITKITKTSFLDVVQCHFVDSKSQCWVYGKSSPLAEIAWPDGRTVWTKEESESHVPLLRKVNAEDAIAGRFYRHGAEALLCVHATDKSDWSSSMITRADGPEMIRIGGGPILQLANGIELVELPIGFTWGDYVPSWEPEIDATSKSVDSSSLSIVQKEPSCEDCKFWKVVADAKDSEGNRVAVGNCRRNAPVADEQGGKWPTTRFTSWCGEFEQNPKLT